MFSWLFNTLLHDPLYNGLIFLISVVPFADVGIAVILLTVIVKLILFPLSLKAVRAQKTIKDIQPELDELKERHKKDKQEQARKTMDLYKQKGINPFSSILLLFIQLPIIFALYWVFFKGGLPMINTEILYSFIQEPSRINMDFLGTIDVAGKSIILAALAGITQFFQVKLSLPPPKPRETSKTPSLKDDFARSFNLQMRYGLPLIVFGVSYVISAAVALYWTTSNIFAIGQEIYVRRYKRGAEKE